ncbi:MAG: hypothetical protein JWP81_2004 [Ferruginibacter sp.]|nr:hypothetical protein [Ferruginibacter sp.]
MLNFFEMFMAFPKRFKIVGKLNKAIGFIQRCSTLAGSIA